MRRLLLLTLLLVALVPAGAAAQTDPFGPLPPGQQATPEPTPEPSTTGQSDVGRGVLLGIAGGVLVLFVAIGWFITRDARRNLTDEDRQALERRDLERAETERKRSKQVKTKARAKGKRQRQARKAQQRRR